MVGEGHVGGSLEDPDGRDFAWMSEMGFGCFCVASVIGIVAARYGFRKCVREDVQ